MNRATSPLISIIVAVFNGKATLSSGMLPELSLLPLYEGQRLWLGMMRRLGAEGFVRWAFEPVFSDPLDGRTLQVDGVFLP